MLAVVFFWLEVAGFVVGSVVFPLSLFCRLFVLRREAGEGRRVALRQRCFESVVCLSGGCLDGRRMGGREDLEWKESAKDGG